MKQRSDKLGYIVAVAFLILFLVGLAWYIWIGHQIVNGATPERNVTMVMNKNELAWCYYADKNSLYCNYAEVDSDKFRLMSSFFEFLNSGIIEVNK